MNNIFRRGSLAALTALTIVTGSSSLHPASGTAATRFTFGPAVAFRATTAWTHPDPTACQAHVPLRLLPTWARAGFSSPKPQMPFVLGQNGMIAAIQFANPLVSPPSPRYNNKILWVSRRPSTPGSALQISARKLVGNNPAGPAVHQTVTGGPAPSIINLPSAGCWQLKLRWSDHSDTIDLRYVT
jgi:hypothetical protein